MKSMPSESGLPIHASFQPSDSLGFQWVAGLRQVLAGATTWPTPFLWVYSSDSIRKEKDSHQEVVFYGEGKYSEERRRRVYSKMLALAQEKLKKGRRLFWMPLTLAADGVKR
jgi:hypothetical protein